MSSWFLNFLYTQFFVTPTYPTQEFTGQTIIVTGSNTGLGLEAARHLVRLNASKVILAVRSLDKGENAKRSIEASTGRKDVVEVWKLDMLSFESVKIFVDQANKLERLDAVLENAGIMTKYFKLVEGFESTITINVISTFLLGFLIIPKLQESAAKFGIQPRLTIVTSDLHFIAKFPEKDSNDILAELNKPNTPSFGERYAVSKLLEVFMVRQLAQELDHSDNPAVIVNCLTPGACSSDFFRESTAIGKVVQRFLNMIFARTTEVGSRTLIAAVGAGKESDGEYMADSKVRNPSKFVISEEGKRLQLMIWKEVCRKIEEIQPGILSNI